MSVSRKCQYALRAIFELAKRHDQMPMRIADIAKAQAIPPKFLELILGQLRQGGFVASRRGRGGGYLLVAQPGDIPVGRIIRFIDGPMAPVACLADGNEADCPLRANCAFMAMWIKARDAVAAVYDETTFQDLLDAEANDRKGRAGEYTI